MADLLLRVRDKESSGDPETDARQSKRGDVVVVCETGWGWGRQELTNPDWRILRLPNVSVDDAGELMRAEVAGLTDTMMRKRRAGLRLEALPASLRAWLADDARAEPIRTVNISRAAFLALVAAKEPRFRVRVL